MATAKFRKGQKVVTDHSSNVYKIAGKHLDFHGHWCYTLKGISGLWAEHQLSKPKK